MSTTTTIRMPNELKTRVAVAAKRSGTTAHGFIIEAINEKTQEDQLRADFEAVAEERYAGIVSSGRAVPWPEMRGYLKARLAGRTVKRPVARRLVR